MLHREWYARFRERLAARVRAEYEARDELERFEDLFPLMRERVAHGSYNPIAERWGVKPNTVAFAMRRLKDRWQAAAIAEAAQTCDFAEDAVDELQSMKAASRLRDAEGRALPEPPRPERKPKPKPET